MRCIALATCLLLGCAASEADMPEAEQYTISGLWRSSNPNSQMPEGALKQASNVVIRQRGMLELRPPFASSSVGSVPSGYTIRRLFPYAGNLLAMARHADASYRVFWAGSGSYVGPIAVSSTSVQPVHGYWPVVEARKNLYIGTTTGVVKLTGAPGLTAARAGLPRPPNVGSEFEGGSAIPNNTSVAWRATIAKRDANDVLVESPPSARRVARNTSGVTRNALVFVYLPTEVSEGDVVRLYRSFSTSSVAPSDEMFLAGEAEVTSADITNGYVEISDGRTNANLGEALYTNPSREGILRANNRPPLARAMAQFRGSTFYGNTLGPHQLLIKSAPPGLNLFGEADGIGNRTVEGDLTASSDVITNVNDTSGIQVGQIMQFGANFNGVGPVLVTAVTSNTITVNHTANTTIAGAAINVFDSIFVNGQPHPANAGGAFTRSVAIGDSANFRTDPQPGVIASLVQANDVEHAILIEELARGGAFFEVRATHGDEYFPPLPDPTISSGLDSTADDMPHGLAWSKNEQPEHVPVIFSTTVGDQRHPILQLLPARDVLYIFKTDGVFRLSGFGADSGWRIDPVDPSLRLLAPGLAVFHDGAVWCWTNRGFGKLSDMGFESVSENAIGADLDTLEATYLPGTLTPTIGAWLVGNQKDNELVLGVAAMGEAVVSAVYVLNTRTGAWTQWDVAELSHTVQSPGSNKLVGAAGNTLHTEDAAGAAFEWLVEWHPPVGVKPHVEKMWQEAIYAFESTRLVGSVAFEFSSSDAAASGPSLAVPDATFPSQHRVWVPAEHARHPRIRPRISGTTQTVEGQITIVQLSGLALTFQPYSTRVKPL
jgi:hypothetical protein